MRGLMQFVTFILWILIAVYVFQAYKDVDTMAADVFVFLALIPLGLIVGSLVWEKGQE